MIELTVRQKLVSLHLHVKVIKPTAPVNVIYMYDHLIIFRKTIPFYFYLNDYQQVYVSIFIYSLIKFIGQYITKLICYVITSDYTGKCNMKYEVLYQQKRSTVAVLSWDMKHWIVIRSISLLNVIRSCNTRRPVSLQFL